MKSGFNLFCLFFLTLLITCSIFGSCAQREKVVSPDHEGMSEEISVPDESARQEETTEPLLPQKTNETINHYTHSVKWLGESLSIIAAWYTGKMENWEQLALINPDLNPNLIHIGDKIQIPGNLLVKTKPMPRSFVEKYLPTQKKKMPEGKKSAREASEKPSSEEKFESVTGETAEEEIQLFGPKNLSQ